MSWEFAPTFDAAHRAALESGKPLIYVCPPAGWAVAPLLDRLPSEAPPGAVLVLAPDPTDASDLSGSLGWIAALRPLLSAQGAARTERLLRAGAVRTLVATPAEALALARRAALKLETLRQVVVAWPESILALGDAPALEAVLADARGAQRLIVTADDRHPALTDFLTRHAHRAPTLNASRPPEVDGRAGAVRYAVVDDQRRQAAVRDLLDQRNASAALIWDPLPSRFGRWMELARDPAVRVRTDPGEDRMDVAIATDLVSREVLAALQAVSGEVVVLVRAGQLPYLGRLAAALRAAPLVGEPDRAHDRAAEARRLVRERLAEGGLDAELMTLAPLFDEYDPALVAAALLARHRTRPGATATPDDGAETAGAAAWVRVFVTAGRKDRLRPADLLGALVNEVGLARDAVGRIELRDAFSLVEVRAHEADRAIRGLTGATIRGKRIAARPDRN
ncbi:MAG TPA: DbpA RNA binding domain-containing protein [Gemmatimonadales bacterium]|nr:DbpA RNA binding domain-containing protein [Gemmatimonadales bacterium]